jgi:N-dimethylarginine dimethylaminohydrolase
VANAVASDTIVVAADRLDETAFAGFKLIRLERGEEFGAGVFPLGERRVVANMRFRTSLDQLRKAGIAVESIDLYDFGKVGLVPANLILALKRT